MAAMMNERRRVRQGSRGQASLKGPLATYTIALVLCTIALDGTVLYCASWDGILLHLRAKTGRYYIALSIAGVWCTVLYGIPAVGIPLDGAAAAWDEG